MWQLIKSDLSQSQPALNAVIPINPPPKMFRTIPGASVLAFVAFKTQLKTSLVDELPLSYNKNLLVANIHHHLCIYGCKCSLSFAYLIFPHEPGCL
jgi:hypothetical protein